MSNKAKNNLWSKAGRFYQMQPAPEPEPESLESILDKLHAEIARLTELLQEHRTAATRANQTRKGHP